MYYTAFVHGLNEFNVKSSFYGIISNF